MLTRRQALSSAMTFVLPWAAKAGEAVRILHVPGEGIQPQLAADPTGNLHILYFSGEARQGNLYYARSADGGATFSSPLRVNSQEGSAIATGTIRGGQIAVGRQGRVHVAWNGSSQAAPRGPLNPDSGKPGEPMLYTRLNDRGDAFEPQRNLMLSSFGLDGGGSVAADRSGNVYVAWHGVGESEAKSTSLKGEARRRVWIAHSPDDGQSFSGEANAWSEETGACGCCGMKIHSTGQGDVLALYRSATASIHRDIYLLSSQDHAHSFQGKMLDKWDINACPMSSMDIAEHSGVVAGAWETGGQVFWTRIGAGLNTAEPVAAPGQGKGRKHPRLAVNGNGEVLLVWTEGTGWQKGGQIAWQLFDRAGHPHGEIGRGPATPVWSFAAVLSRPDNGFTIIC